MERESTPLSPVTAISAHRHTCVSCAGPTRHAMLAVLVIAEPASSSNAGIGDHNVTHPPRTGHAPQSCRMSSAPISGHTLSQQKETCPLANGTWCLGSDSGLAVWLCVARGRCLAAGRVPPDVAVRGKTWCHALREVHRRYLLHRSLFD